ncbi:oligosaccharide flippase family protein [Exiguobacterium sp. s183]|uniref:oligosaccharide flippase family protein n=1 Tax=Exiguobacterium sp. s183 TaxID=2751262 RepID=UPI001BEBE30B
MKNFFYLVSGSIIAQIITVVSTPLLTRIFTPEEFGQYMILLSFTGLFMTASNARYDVLIVSCQKKEIPSLMIISLWISLVIAMLSSIIFAVLNLHTKLVDVPFYSILAIFLIVSSYGIINVLISYNNRNENYQLISYITVIRSIFQNLGSIVFGLFNLGYFGLLLAYILGQVFGMKKQAIGTLAIFKKGFSVPLKEHLAVMIKYKNQPLYSMPSIIVNNLSYTLVIVIVSSLYGASYVGFYTLALRLLALPLNVISGNMSKIIMKQASLEFESDQTVKNTFVRYALILAALSFPVFISIYYVSPYFGVIFGSDWEEAGDIISILLLMFGVRFIVTSLSPIFIILNKQIIDFQLQSMFIVISIILFIISNVNNFSFEKFLSYLNFFYTLIYILYFVVLMKFSIKRRESK